MDRRDTVFTNVRDMVLGALKELEKQNSQLKKLVADLSLDNAILKEAAYPNS